MAGPAQNGVLIYSAQVAKLAEFYQQVFALQLQRSTEDFISLSKDGFHLIIHRPPFDLPVPALSSLKLFLTVTDMQASRRQVQQAGGQLFDGEWQNSLFKVSNVTDPEGNQIQLREFSQ
jgi:predicted enzyme related to lactoylglutathione lyase